MVAYTGAKGGKVQNFSSDPTNPYVGQVWYNSTSSALKVRSSNASGAWSTGGTMNTARGVLGGVGTQTAALAFGGLNNTPALTGATESYNGTAWTSSPNSMNTARRNFGNAGIQTAALGFGGIGPPGGQVGNNESWNGTSWTEVNDLNTARQSLGGAGTNTATLVVEDTSNSIHRIYYNPPTSTDMLRSSGSYYTVSFYIKPAGRTRGASFWEWPSGRVGVIYDLNTTSLSPYFTLSGSLYASSIETAPNGYYRISYTARDTASYNSTVHTFFRLADDAGNLTYTGNGTSGSYIWGLQVEQNTYATPYISSSSTVLGARTTWQDLSGNNNITTLQSASISGSIPVFPAANNRVLNFNGTSSFALVPGNSILQPSSSITIESVFQRNSGRTIMSYSNNNGGAAKTYSFEHQGPIQGRIVTTSGGTTLSGPTINSDTWYHIILTYDGSLVALYLNGTLVASSTTSGSLSYAADGNLNIGRKNSFDGEYIQGKVQVARVYNRALTQAEITQNYNALKSRFGLQ